jgi:hypothetical protein
LAGWNSPEALGQVWPVWSDFPCGKPDQDEFHQTISSTA